MNFLSAIKLTLPSIISIILGLLVINSFPSTSNKARSLIIFAFCVLTIRYLIWRSLHTFNFTNKYTTIASLIFFLFELFGWLLLLTSLVLNIKRKYCHDLADENEKQVISGQFSPTVDIFIPTYNESIDILRRTIIGCQAINYQNKEIYLLDDGNRQEIAILAQNLGCQYIKRKDNTHAKAGNLNHALPLTNGEFIAVFDADFIPCRNFLTRTLGFFQQPKLALLQTNHHFYNQDSVTKNWGVEDKLGYPGGVFISHIQPSYTAYNSASCLGSSFVIRRSMLEEIGGFCQDSVTEDFYTIIKLLTHNYQSLHLYETLSAGLSPENIPSLFKQRMRWAKGFIQGFFIKANPLTIKGLNLIQRILYGSSVINYFGNFTLLSLLIIFPLLFIIGIPPINVNLNDWIIYFLPLFFFQFLTFSWLGENIASKIAFDIYSIILTFPVSLTIIQTLISPFKGTFTVTPKGITNNKTIFYWGLAMPMIFAWLIAFFSTMICGILVFYPDSKLQFLVSANNIQNTSKLGLFWAIYQLFALTLAIFALIEKPETDPFPWLKIKTQINLKINNYQLTGFSTKLSETGINLEIKNADYMSSIIKDNVPIKIEILEAKLKLKCIIKKVEFTKEQVKLKLTYQSLSLQEYRNLVEFLFCTPNRWQTTKILGEWQSFLVLSKVLIKNILTLPWQFKHKKLYPSINHLKISNQLIITK